MKYLSSKDPHITTVATATLKQSIGGAFERLKNAMSRAQGDSEEVKLATVDCQKLFHVPLLFYFLPLDFEHFLSVF